MVGKSNSGKEKQFMDKSYRMTTAITKDVEGSPDHPTIVSLGTDGWASDVLNIKAYLSRMRTPFTLVVCHTSALVGQENRLSAQHLTMGTRGVWWGSYTSADFWPAYRTLMTLQRRFESLLGRGMRYRVTRTFSRPVSCYSVTGTLRGTSSSSYADGIIFVAVVDVCLLSQRPLIFFLTL
jgi:hypothetical protein